MDDRSALSLTKFKLISIMCVRAFTAQNNQPEGGILQDKPDCQNSLWFKLVGDMPLHQRALSRDFLQTTSENFSFLSSYFNTTSGTEFFKNSQTRFVSFSSCWWCKSTKSVKERVGYCLNCHAPAKILPKVFLLLYDSMRPKNLAVVSMKQVRFLNVGGILLFWLYIWSTYFFMFHYLLPSPPK